MADFFQRMEDAMSTGAGGDDVPALLQDHPVTTVRISDAKARAHQLIADMKQRPSGLTLDRAQWASQTAPIAYVKDPTRLLASKPAPGSLDTFLLMRERVRVLAGDARQLSLYYASNLAKRHGFDTPSNRYGYALALTRSGNGAKAVDELQPLLGAHPDDQVLRLAMAGALLQAGQRARSLAIYAGLNAASPRNRAIALAYAKALTQGGNTEEAAQAAALLRPLLDESDEPDVYTAYARASDKAGNSELAGEAFADASYLSGRPFDAVEQLKRLLKRPDLDYYARARIQGRLAQLVPLVMELRKRKIQTPDNPDNDGRQ
jgi:predicted Zn-dependent protease